MGHQPHAQWMPKPTPNPSVETWINGMLQLRKEAHSSILNAQNLMARTPKAFTPYQPGDQVWLEGTHIQMTHPMAKLAPKRHGPFTIKEAISNVTYHLELPPTWKIWNTFHASLLTPYKETDTHGPNFKRPPPELIKGEEEYEVEQVLDSRKFGQGGTLQYLIKWKGYPDSENQCVRLKFGLLHNVCKSCQVIALDQLPEAQRSRLEMKWGSQDERGSMILSDQGERTSCPLPRLLRDEV
jgi:hypothetical protein